MESIFAATIPTVESLEQLQKLPHTELLIYRLYWLMKAENTSTHVEYGFINEQEEMTWIATYAVDNEDIPMNAIFRDESSDYYAACSQWIKEHDIKQGSTVRVKRRAAFTEHGWQWNWRDGMEATIGHKLEVKFCGGGSISLRGIDGNFPYFILEPIIEEN